MRGSYFPFLLLITSCQESAKNFQKESEVTRSIKVNELDYSELKRSIDRNRVNFKLSFFSANVSTRQVILKKAKDYLVQTIGDDLYKQWQGTRWDFNGTTSKPKEGTIACGYFVNTLLQDAGYKVNRTKLSICPSLTMMKTLTSSESIQNLSRLTYDNFVRQIKNYGKGLFLVGLDFHTGFIVNDGTNCWFLHSNYIQQEGVIKERLTESLALKSSKTRYLTCLTDSKKFLLHWLLN